MNKVNYDKVMQQTINSLSGTKPRLLLHVCCAPCSSGVFYRLVDFFDISVLFYNPNISEFKEYEKRKQEFVRFNTQSGLNLPVLECEYDAQSFIDVVRGLEHEKEGGERCTKCFELRLNKTAQIALKNGFEYFTTTLSVSPYKNADKLNKIGCDIAQKYGAKYLVSDFKKQGGYLRSIENSKKYNLYRQDYCGCIYSKIQSEQNKKTS